MPEPAPTGGDGKQQDAPAITVQTPSGTTSQEPGKPQLLQVPGAKEQSPSLGGETLRPNPSSSPKDGGDHDEDPLKPDPNSEEDFVRENNKFAFTPGQLGKLLNPKSLAALKAMGGIKGLETGLRTDLRSGLSADESHLDGQVSFEQATNVHYGAEDTAAPAYQEPAGEAATTNTVGTYDDRKAVFGENRLPEKKGKNIFELMWIAFNDKILILLSCAAAISLALGLYQTFGVKHAPGTPKVEWIEGVAIMVAVVIVVVVGAGNDWQKERQFVKLNKKKEDRIVNVVRSGKTIQLSVFDIMVGDIIHLEPGDLIPVDGIFISGHNVKCDESSATGESDQLKKTPCAEVMARMEAGEDTRKLDPFIISGAKVLEGVGTFVVTSVGPHSAFGKIMMALREETEATPLQMKLNNLAEAIAKLGGASALLLFIILFIKFLTQLKGSKETAAEKGQGFMRILVTAITVVVVAVPEGLPLAVTLALAFATTRMLKDNNLVRVLRACETSGNATTICSDKTGTLTQNKMTVVAGTIGTTVRFGDVAAEDSNDNKTVEKKGSAESLGQTSGISDVGTLLSNTVKQTLLQSIAVNSTAFEGEENGEFTFIGSKTETAMLNFAKNYLGMGPVAEERDNANIVQAIPFDSGRKCMGTVVKLDNGTFRCYVKGASEILLGRCSKIVGDVKADNLDEINLVTEDVEMIKQAIDLYANRSLRTIATIYRDFQAWPPAGASTLPDDPTQVEFDSIFENMTFLGLVGIMDPLRDGVRKAVEDCQKAGIFVRMVTGDNVVTARAIATECGIFTKGGVIMEGPKFRTLSKAQMNEVVPRLQVLARSSPEDKRILVKKLKELGETVAVTGDGTNDGPALKMADVGFSMGIAGTEVAKEASAIILMDDNFASIVKAIMWGRAVNDAVKKFLQFQLTVNITAVLTTFITAVYSDKETSVLTAVQLLWVNLIMDTFAALALATDPPTPAILDRKPVPKSAPLITLNMWKMILGQAVYQMVVSLTLYFAGRNILDMPPAPTDPYAIDPLRALVFNTFVWMQIFNQYNNRRLDNKFNIFEGILQNRFFIVINVVMVGGQVAIMFVGGRAFQVTGLTGVQWAVCLILGAISIPFGFVLRLIPDEFLAKLVPSWMHRKPHHGATIYASNEDRFQWNEGIEAVREELSFLKTIRGGRLNQLKFSRPDLRRLLPGASKNNSTQPSFFEDFSSETGTKPPATSSSSRRRRSRSNSAFAAAALVPSLVAGSIGGWSPIERQGEGENATFGNRQNLEATEGLSVHPATDKDDKVLADQPKEGDLAPSQVEGVAPASAVETVAAEERDQKKSEEVKR